MTPLQKSILNAVKRRPMTLRELQNNLQVDNSRLRTTVSAMVATGELSMRNGTYVPGFATYENAAAPNTIPCTLVKLAARFGFASRDDGEGDIFIPGRALHGAMPNDKINVKLFDHPRVEGSSEGEVVEVTVPNNRFAGTVCLSEDGRMAVEPDGCRDVKFLLAKQGSEGVHLGDKVGFLITHRGNRHSDHRAAVVEKFGSSDYALSGHMDALSRRRDRITVLTPHEGEFVRAGGDLSPGRERAAADFAREHGVYLVLKGPGTIVAAPDGRCMRNPTGNCGMAKGGSGDVLAGMLVSLLGLGLPPMDACCAAVWLHGRAGDLAAREVGLWGMTPSDLLDRIPAALREVTE